MKLSRLSLLILGIGIFVIAAVTIYYINSTEMKEQAQLNDRLAVAQVILPQITAERKDWQDKLTQAENNEVEARLSLDYGKTVFPEIVESFTYTEALFETAYDCELQVVELTASEPSDEKVKDTDITYAVSTFKVVVQSVDSPPSEMEEFETYIDETVFNMLKFIDAIATGSEYNISNITQVDMANLEPLDEEQLEDIAEQMEKWPKATILLNIYGFPR